MYRGRDGESIFPEANSCEVLSGGFLVVYAYCKKPTSVVALPDRQFQRSGEPYGIAKNGVAKTWLSASQ